jgi:4-alpha-glucanotransferase
MTRVARSYVDALGTPRAASDATVARFEALLDDGPRPFLAPTTVLRADAPVAVDLTLPAIAWMERAEWQLLLEDGATYSGTVALRDADVVAVEERSNGTFDTRRIPLERTLPLGVHRISVSAGGYGRAAAALVIVPAHGELPVGRTWGIALQLYTLRSERNLGIGDFADLQAFCAAAGARGATYIGINPLHAGFRGDPEAASPYSASSRRWLQWLAIAVDDLPEAASASVRSLRNDPAMQTRVAALQAAPFVDYAGVAAVKDALLRACFAEISRVRSDALAAWRVAQGDALARFAAFEAIVQRYGRDLAAWPASLRDPRSPDVALFAASASDEVDYACYLQWCAAEQLAATARAAEKHGARLYRDLAVGVDGGAADVWADAAAYVVEATVGAPPDELNTLGQDWGLPPLDPRGLMREGYAEFLALLEANCRDAGALRIDHAMSLARLYWIPRGGDARSGTYVTYPLDDLRGLVALVSARSRCIVVGEDLGTVPEGFREMMKSTGVLSYRILFFERDATGAYVPPAGYPRLALAASGTHDLPTIPMWLRGDDIALRAELGLSATSLEEERSARDGERARFLDALVTHGGLAESERDDDAAVVIAANRYLAASPSAIVMAQLDDIVVERTPVNVPGTSNEYPNWRRKLALDLDTIIADARFNRLCSALREVRPRTS